MINCSNFKENICAYIDDELNIKERLSFEEHVKNCRECKTELDEMSQIVGLCKGLPQYELPLDFKAELHEKLVAVARRQEDNMIRFRKPKGFFFLKTVAAIAAAMLLVLLAGNFLRSGLLSPVKMQGSANSTASVADKAIAASDGAQAYEIEPGAQMAGDSGSLARTFGAAGAADAAPQAPEAPAQAAAPNLAPAGTAEVDRSAAVQNREAAISALSAGTESVSSKLSTITVSAVDPNTLPEKIKTLAIANNAEIVENKVTVAFSESMTAAKQTNSDQTVTAADNAGSPAQQQLVFTVPGTQYEQFVSALNIEFGAANVQVGAFVTEDMTTALDTVIAESNEIDNRIQTLQKTDGTKNASEIEELKAQKEAADKRIDDLRLGNDFVNVTIFMNGK